MPKPSKPAPPGPAVAFRSRDVALLAGLAATVSALAGARFLLGDSSPEMAGLALVAAGAVAGAATSAAAGTYYSGNPAVAYGASVALFQYGSRLVAPRAWQADPFLLAMDLSAAILAVIAGLAACTAAAWATDVGFNFPRAWPDPATRPQSKHVSREDYRTRILPGTVVLALLGAAATAILAGPLPAGGVGKVASGLLFAGLLLLGPRWVVRRFKMPGALWVGVGPLLGMLAVVAGAGTFLAPRIDPGWGLLGLPQFQDGALLPGCALALAVAGRPTSTLPVLSPPGGSPT